MICRGAERKNLFNDDEDYQCMLLILYRLKMEMSFEIHAYCLINNRMHLLIREKVLGGISLIMKRAMTRYAIYFNRKYGRSGAIMTNRYKSTPVDVDENFLPLVLHIHQCPVQARLVAKMEDYSYSSYRNMLLAEIWRKQPFPSCLSVSGNGRRYIQLTGLTQYYSTHPDVLS